MHRKFLAHTKASLNYVFYEPVTCISVGVKHVLMFYCAWISFTRRGISSQASVGCWFDPRLVRFLSED